MSGVTTSQGSESDREKTPWGSPQRLNASPVLLVECWRIDKLWTNRDRSNQSSYFFVQTTSENVYYSIWTIL